MSRRNHNGYENDNFVDDSYGRNYEDDPDYNPEQDVDGGAGYGPYSTGYARSGPGDRRLDGGRDRRKNPNNNNNNYDDDDDNDYDDDDYDDYDNNYQGQGGYGPYSTGYARSGPGDRRLDGGRDERKKPGGNNPQGYNGYTAGNNRSRSRSRNRGGNRGDNYNSNNNQNQGGYGPYSTGYARSGPGDRRLDGGHDERKKPGGNNPQGYNGYTAGNNSNRNRNNQNDYDDDDYDSDNNNNNNYSRRRNQSQNQNQGGYGSYSTGKARSGQGDRRLDGGHDGRKKPGGNNPQGYNGYTSGNNRNRNRNNQNDNDDDYDSEDYGQNTRKQQNYGYNQTGRQNRSGPGDRRLDGGRDQRKKPNRSQNYQNNY